MSTALAPQSAPSTQLAGLPASALPAPVDKKALTAYLAVLEDPAALELQQRLAKAYDAACKALIGENDVQKEGGREFKKKSAWRKLQRYFSISTTVVSIEKEFIGEEFMATVTVRGIAPWGQTSESAGSCATDEETGRRTITMADAVGTAETRATNRVVSNLIAMGEVSAEEIGERGRGDRQRPEMGLEEANTVTWPWNEPEKYKGKPLADVTTLSLLRVQDWAQKKIEAGRAGKQVERMLEAVTIIISNRDDADQAQQQWEAEQSKKAGQGSEAKASEGAAAAAPSSSSAEGEQRPDPTSSSASATSPTESAGSTGSATTPSRASTESAAPPATTSEPARSDPTVDELNAVANTAAAQATVVDRDAQVQKESLTLMTQTVSKMLVDGAFAADVRTRVRKRLATTENLTTDVLEAAIAEIEAGRLPF